MPLHDFKCRACGHEFEALVRAGSPAACTACGGGDLEQLLSTFAVSSATIRKSNLQAVRSKAATARESKLHDDHAAMKRHLQDH